MSKDPPVIHWMILAHSYRGDVSRCVMVPAARGKSVAVCARCLGLYPTLISMIAIQIGVEPGRAMILDWWITIAGIGPALIDWGLSRLSIWRGNNLSRIATGVLAGGALSRSLYLYFREPVNEVFGVQLMIICFCVFAVEIARQFQTRRNNSPNGR
jgi:uncharacterized membrane protein